MPSVEQAKIGLIRTQAAQLIGAGDPGAGKGIVGCGAKISDAGNGISHVPRLDRKPGGKKDQMLAQSVIITAGVCSGSFVVWRD